MIWAKSSHFIFYMYIYAFILDKCSQLIPDKCSQFIPDKCSQFIPDKYSQFIPDKCYQFIPDKCSQFIPEKCSDRPTIWFGRPCLIRSACCLPTHFRVCLSMCFRPRLSSVKWLPKRGDYGRQARRYED